MSEQLVLDLDDTVRHGEARTERGTFATLRCEPQGRAVPRGQVLFIPGFTGSKEDFGALLSLLAAAGWSAAAYDQRGQYETGADPGDDFSLSGLAADAATVSTAVFGPAEPVHLVGHSFGGLVASTAAIEIPDAWASLTLMCSGPAGFDGAARRDLLRLADSVATTGMEGVWAFGVENNRANGVPPDPPQIEEFLHRRMLAHSPDALAAMARLLAQTPDLTARLASLDVPISILRGERDDAWAHDLQDDLARAVGTKCVVIDDAAHSPAVEQPEETRDALVRSWMG